MGEGEPVGTETGEVMGDIGVVEVVAVYLLSCAVALVYWGGKGWALVMTGWGCCWL
jgi:hypothetical protein